MTEYIFTGEPCQNGHIAKRYKSSRTCVECNREAVARYQQDKARLAANAKRWDENHREQVNAAKRNWKSKNPEKVRGYNAGRSRRVVQATPAWVDKEELRRIYRDRPDNMQVDHVVPINGENVSGLHIPANLQYLTPKENNEKSNHFPPME